MTVMPVTGDRFAVDAAARASVFHHAQEHAAPAAYSVMLDRYNTRVELTGTARAGVLRITFPAGTPATLLFQQYVHAGEGSVQISPAGGMISGFNPVRRLYQGSGKTAGFSGYFAARINHPVLAGGTWCDGQQHPGKLTQPGSECKSLGAFATLGDTRGTPVEVMVGTSFTSVEEAEKNLDAEIGSAASTRWSKRLKRNGSGSWASLRSRAERRRSAPFSTPRSTTPCWVRVRPTTSTEGITASRSRAPSTCPPATKTAEYYDDFSMWDTYRALHPLLTLLDPERQQRMVQSLVLKGEQGGFLPIFPMWNNYTSEMIGDHIPVVIADAYMKGLRHFDVAAAYRLAFQNATVTPPYDQYVDGKGRRALEDYSRLGFIPLDNPVLEAFHRGEQVSRTLEYAFDDAILADFATALGKTADAAMLRKRSENWRNVIDASVGFARGRYADGSWIQPFDPAKPGDITVTAKDGRKLKEQYVTESNPYIYTFYVPQNVPGLIGALGGNQKFIAAWMACSRAAFTTRAMSRVTTSRTCTTSRARLRRPNCRCGNRLRCTAMARTVCPAMTMTARCPRGGCSAPWASIPSPRAARVYHRQPPVLAGDAAPRGWQHLRHRGAWQLRQRAVRPLGDAERCPVTRCADRARDPHEVGPSGLSRCPPTPSGNAFTEQPH